MLSLLMLVKHPCYSDTSTRRIMKECPTPGQVVRVQWGLPYGTVGGDWLLTPKSGGTAWRR